MRKLALLLVLALIVGSFVPAMFAENYVSAQVIDRVSPIRPAEARLRGVSGTIQLTLSIDERGNVAAVDVVRGLPLRGFGLEAATIDAVKQWRFRPATRDGVAVASTFPLTVRYRYR